MFTFHRPKIYRSVAGCCICKAKSSSSRFTDSKKYETEFKDCFNLLEGEQRKGEICNACVLLIKRWKKLPKGTERNWNHVVDARAGPGGKSQLRQKLKTQSQKSSSYSTNCNNNNPNVSLSDHGWARRARRRSLMKKNRKKRMNLLDGLDTRRNTDSEDLSPPSPTLSDVSDTSDSVQHTTQPGSMSPDSFDGLPPLLSAIIDTSYWKMERICCGTIFKGARNELMIHPQLLNPCPNSCLGPHRPNRPSSASPSNPNTSVAAATTKSTKAIPSRDHSIPVGSVAASKCSPVPVGITSKRGARQDSVGSEESNVSGDNDEIIGEEAMAV